MPELCRFRGIIIKMLYLDNAKHNKPHVHVYYGEYSASIALDGELLSGSLPINTLKMVIGWLTFNEDEVYSAWNNAVQGIPFNKIKPM